MATTTTATPSLLLVMSCCWQISGNNTVTEVTQHQTCSWWHIVTEKRASTAIVMQSYLWPSHDNRIHLPTDYRRLEWVWITVIGWVWMLNANITVPKIRRTGGHRHHLYKQQWADYLGRWISGLDSLLNKSFLLAFNTCITKMRCLIFLTSICSLIIVRVKF